MRTLTDCCAEPLIFSTLFSQNVVMVLLAACVGLRRSEIFGLRWSDFNWLLREVFIQRSHVEGYEDETKTESSNAKLPLHPAIIEALLAWRQQSPFNGSTRTTTTCLQASLGWKETAEQQQRPAGLSPTRVDQGGIKAAGLARAAALVSHVAGREGNWSGSAEGTDAALDYCDVAGRLWSWSSRSETGGECHGRKRSFAMNSLNGLLTDCVEA